ncbi:hypothetical protein KC19_VG190300 [Ceratodon purpureus]|uniref:Uncharacterized protein n=1 Tax=Ceratodon purpureus TaxID=3225 RepID=A0A8T0HS41_CERPU|nr:hypothetical protein KC19_VG190300 [Ceratodon purpureus]
MEGSGSHSFDSELNVGDKVWIAKKDDSKVSVGRGRVFVAGGFGLFHHKPIRLEYVRVDLEIVLENTPLLVPVHGADQVTFENYKGLLNLYGLHSNWTAMRYLYASVSGK